MRSVSWSWQMLDCLLILFSAAMSNSVVPFAKIIEFVSWGNMFPSCIHLFEDFTAAQPFLLRQVNNQLVHDFLSQQNTRLFLFLSELTDLFVAGRDQSAADQPNNLAEGHHCNGFICSWPRPVSSRSAKRPGWRSPPIVTIITIVVPFFPFQVFICRCAVWDTKPS